VERFERLRAWARGVKLKESKLKVQKKLQAPIARRGGSEDRWGLEIGTSFEL
jgi:hypothetical protein